MSSITVWGWDRCMQRPHSIIVSACVGLVSLWAYTCLMKLLTSRCLRLNPYSTVYRAVWLLGTLIAIIAAVAAVVVSRACSVEGSERDGTCMWVLYVHACTHWFCVVHVHVCMICRCLGLSYPHSSIIYSFIFMPRHTSYLTSHTPIDNRILK